MSSIDDIDELIATRKLNGLEDNLFKDINTEDNIKRCEKLTEPQNANWIGISNQKAIAGVLARIKELEKENIQLEAIKGEAIKRYNFESIPKQKLKNKIEELNKEYIKELEKNSTKAFILKCQITIVEEILEDK